MEFELASITGHCLGCNMIVTIGGAKADDMLSFSTYGALLFCEGCEVHARLLQKAGVRFDFMAFERAEEQDSKALMNGDNDENGEPIVDEDAFYLSIYRSCLDALRARRAESARGRDPEAV